MKRSQSIPRAGSRIAPFYGKTAESNNGYVQPFCAEDSSLQAAQYRLTIAH
jgi:hypothetical protein